MEWQVVMRKKVEPLESLVKVIKKTTHPRMTLAEFKLAQPKRLTLAEFKLTQKQVHVQKAVTRVQKAATTLRSDMRFAMLTRTQRRRALRKVAATRWGARIADNAMDNAMDEVMDEVMEDDDNLSDVLDDLASIRDVDDVDDDDVSVGGRTIIPSSMPSEDANPLAWNGPSMDHVFMSW